MREGGEEEIQHSEFGIQSGEVAAPASSQEQVQDSPIEPEAVAEAAGVEAAPVELSDAPPVEEEENIYEVMKQHMRRQKEELEAKNVELRQARPAGYGRPGPVSAKAPAAAVEKVGDVSDLTAVWAAAQKFLGDNQARSVVLNLGAGSRIIRLEGAEAELEIPAHLRAYAGDKIRARMEEAIRAVTGLGIRLVLSYREETAKAAADAEASRNGAPAPGIASQRVPAEVMEAVKQQKVVQELMKRLDASVVNVELLGTGEGEA